MTVEGKVALVTGASEGIGYAIAEELVTAGAKVVLTARRAGPLAAAAERLGSAAAWVVADQADTATAALVVRHALEQFGALDLLVCNAGILIPGLLAEQPLALADLVISVNLRGTIAVMQAAVPALAGRPEAAAVIVSSAIGRHPTPGMGVYGATKAALHYLVPTWAAELAPRGIRVNAVCAGITDTPGLREGAKHVPGLEAMVVATNLVKRIASPDEIARPVISLLDTACTGYVNGTVWDVDGGYLRDLSGASHASA